MGALAREKINRRLPLISHYEVQPEKNTFSHIFVDLTHKCNMACANCYVPNRTIPDLDISKLYEFAARLPKPVTFRLIGGEPTLRKDLPEIISKLGGLGHQTTLFTNGLLLEDNYLVSELKSAGLNRLQLSMNGGTLDSVYKITDSINCADKKIKALKNLVSNQLVTSIGMIVVSETISAPAIRTLVSLVEDVYSEFGKRKDKAILIPSLRFRSIAKLGRHIDSELSFSELIRIVKSNISTQDAVFQQSQCGSDYFRLEPNCETKSVISTIQSKVGPIFVKITDWKVNSSGVVDHDSRSRGRLTKNWTAAPFFEDVKVNEFGY